ncbi:sugar phosphate isomerase/epimerase family protein [Delftia sp. PS-11]|uniref:sugar phosphate isomerase/epimerase family protein n=1 Tax=Delftia sp. PS-11 TaxID=2767222 RepID=UPI002454FAEE|nr:sugar phosphate isomerase/epimerase family protein [Delftia sp. PS-11]KAJ8742627.1 sugar phosphate isomerase/epimerase [Delftia sp. PS-11]
MNQLGIHALVWAGDLSPQSIRHVIAQTHQAGYGLVELSLHGPRIMDLALTRDLLQEHGLAVGCSRGLTFDADVSSEDPAVVARGIAMLQEGIDITQRIGGRYFGGVLYSAMAKYGHPCSPQGRRHALEALRRVADFAGERGVTLGLEVVNRYESHVLNTAAQALEFIDEAGCANLCVHLDTYHMNIEEADLATPVLACGDRLGYVHIGENHRGYLGSGHIDFTRFFDALARIGYRGTVTFESFSSSVVNEQLSNALGIWRNLWDDGMDLARHAHGFMAEGLAQAHGRARP